MPGSKSVFFVGSPSSNISITSGGAATQPLTQMVNSDVVDGKIREDAPPAQLYNLKDDPGQQTTLHDKHPDVVKELAAELAKWRKEIKGPRLGWINIKLK